MGREWQDERERQRRTLTWKRRIRWEKWKPREVRGALGTIRASGGQQLAGRQRALRQGPEDHTRRRERRVRVLESHGAEATQKLPQRLPRTLLPVVQTGGDVRRTGNWKVNPGHLETVDLEGKCAPSTHRSCAPLLLPTEFGYSYRLYAEQGWSRHTRATLSAWSIHYLPSPAKWNGHTPMNFLCASLWIAPVW